MPSACCVPGCNSNYDTKPRRISVFQFPNDEPLRKKWVSAIHRADFVPRKRSVVCIKHFDSRFVVREDSVKRPDGTILTVKRERLKLTGDAFPTYFQNVPVCLSKELPALRKDPDERREEIEKICEVNKLAREEADCIRNFDDLKCSFVNKCKLDINNVYTKVKFKPEMWKDGLENLTTEKQSTKKRPTIRHRKILNAEASLDDTVIKSECISCCALACTNTSETSIMNCLPQDPHLRQLWVEKIDRFDWTPEDDSALCEIHFEVDDWDYNVGEEKILNPKAVPTLFLHGEGIKSWVTMDNAGNVENVVVEGKHCPEDAEGQEQSGSDEEDSDIFVKGEALEPEIDMVEGSEDLLSREPSSTEERFETIYCDSAFDGQEDESSEESHIVHGIKQEPITEEYLIQNEGSENPLDPDSILPDDSINSLSDVAIIQDVAISSISDSSLKTETDQSTVEASNYFVISEQNQRIRKIKRRSSSQLTPDFQCPICDRRLSRRKNLEIHIEKLHPNGELTESQKRKKKELNQQCDEVTIGSQAQFKFKKPPPALTPIIPQCLMSPSPPVMPPVMSPSLVQSSLVSIPLPPTLVATPTTVVPTALVTTTSFVETTPLVVTTPSITSSLAILPPVITPSPLATSPTLVVSSTSVTSASIVTPPTVISPKPVDPNPAGEEMKKILLLMPKQPPAATDDSQVYSVDLPHVPLEKRILLKEKLRELIDAVVTKNLDPDKIIIAYDRT